MLNNSLFYIIIFSLFVSANASAEFIGELLLKPISKSKYEVTQDFSYKDRKGNLWTTRKGYHTDGASIPRELWSFIGDPYGGGYIKAAVIHDQACDEKKRTWQETHRVFFDAMLDEGVSPSKAYVMYAAVYRFGPRWDYNSMSNGTNALGPYYYEIMETPPIPRLPPRLTNDTPLTIDKLKAIEAAVKKLEESGPVTAEDLENIKIN